MPKRELLVASVDSGINASYDFDVMDRLTDIAWENDNQQVIRSFAMTYARDPQQQTDLGTDMIERIDREDGTYRVYAYDSLDRLTGEQHFDDTDTLLYSASYTYDLAGNRTQTTINGVTHTYTLAQTGDRLASWGVNGENTLTYDSAGNVTQRVVDGQSTLDLAWDLEYRLTEVSSGGNPVESYQYDPTGRRIRTVNSGGATWHVHDGAHVIADVDDQGELIRSYTWGPGIDNLLALTVHDGQTSETYYAVTDHLGTVHALVDDNGNVSESYRYDAFGNVLGVFDANGQPLPSSGIGNRYLFQGREYSWATGLYNFRARWYDPLTGRWLSNDPIGISGGLNQYVAFGNNPVMFVDPWGLSAEKERFAIIAAAREWNRTSRTWRPFSNECGGQALALVDYLGSRGFQHWTVTLMGGGRKRWLWGTIGNHNVVLVYPSPLTSDTSCDFILDPFKPAWTIIPGLDRTGVTVRTPQEFRREYPIPFYGHYPDVDRPKQRF